MGLPALISIIQYLDGDDYKNYITGMQFAHAPWDN